MRKFFAALLASVALGLAGGAIAQLDGDSIAYTHAQVIRGLVSQQQLSVARLRRARLGQQLVDLSCTWFLYCDEPQRAPFAAGQLHAHLDVSLSLSLAHVAHVGQVVDQLLIEGVSHESDVRWVAGRIALGHIGGQHKERACDGPNGDDAHRDAEHHQHGA